MALYSLNLEVRSRKRGSERARVPAPALIHRNCVLRLSSLLRLQRSPSACGRGGGAPAPCLAPVACQFVAGGPRGWGQCKRSGECGPCVHPLTSVLGGLRCLRGGSKHPPWESTWAFTPRRPGPEVSDSLTHLREPVFLSGEAVAGLSVLLGLPVAHSSGDYMENYINCEITKIFSYLLCLQRLMRSRRSQQT